MGAIQIFPRRSGPFLKVFGVDLERNGMLYHSLDCLKELFVFIPFITECVCNFITCCWHEQSEGQHPHTVLVVNIPRQSHGLLSPLSCLREFYILSLFKIFEIPLSLSLGEQGLLKIMARKSRATKIR